MAIKTIIISAGKSILDFFRSLIQNPKSLLIIFLFVSVAGNGYLTYLVYQQIEKRSAIQNELEEEREAQQDAIDEALEEAEEEWEQFEDPFSDNPDFEFDFDEPTTTPSELNYEEDVAEGEAEIRKGDEYEVFEEYAGDDGSAARDNVRTEFAKQLGDRFE